MKTSWRAYASLGLALLYLVVVFGFTGVVESLGMWQGYALEGAIIALSIAINWAKFKEVMRWDSRAAVTLPVLLLLGWVSYHGAAFRSITIPFNLTEPTTLVLLILVGPILEELIFRFVLWVPTKRFFGTMAAWMLTTLAFSYSHLHAFWNIPAEYHQFIVYQTGYTMLLGTCCGFAMARFRSLPIAIVFHALFNLGFFIGSQI